MTKPETGMLVQIDPRSLKGADPTYRGKLATIQSVEGKHPGQGDRIFVTLRFHASGLIEGGISADMLVLA